VVIDDVRDDRRYRQQLFPSRFAHVSAYLRSFGYHAPGPNPPNASGKPVRRAFGGARLQP